MSSHDDYLGSLFAVLEEEAFRGQWDQSMHCAIKKMMGAPNNPDILIDGETIVRIMDHPAYRRLQDLCTVFMFMTSSEKTLRLASKEGFDPAQDYLREYGCSSNLPPCFSEYLRSKSEKGVRK